MDYEKHYERRYKKALERASEYHFDGVKQCIADTLEYIFPELKKNKAEWIEKIRQELKSYLSLREVKQISESDAINQWLAWLEQQGDVNKDTYEIAEKEKNDFVSGQYIECRASFNKFKEDNSYWLEYIGNDTYIGRSDNILNEKFHITPRQLFTLFTQQHCPKDNNEQNENAVNTEDGNKKLIKNGYTHNKDVIEYANKYSHEVWNSLMDNFKNIVGYGIGCNDVSDIVLNAIIDTYNWIENEKFSKNNLEQETKNDEGETNAPSGYGKYVDECLNEAAKHFFSEGEDKYSVADLFYAGVRCGKSWLEKQSVKNEYTFKSITRLLDMIEPSDRAKVYCQKLIDTLAKEGYNTDAKIVENVLNAWNGEDVPMAVMDEKKTADKVEPKFHEGDWVVTDKNNIVQIKAVNNDYYSIDNGMDFTVSYVDGYWHLWTIQDAKDGDVLVTNSNIIFIFKYLDEEGTIAFRASCTENSGVYFPKIKERLCDQDAYPATKEQRDLLFSKMKNMGYEWDAEKKEVMRIDNEEYNGEDYGIDSLFHAQRILEKTLGSVDGYQTDDGILSHQCAITAVKKLYEQKPAWSKEDELMKLSIEQVINCACWSNIVPEEKIKIKTWLKQLKHRIGG